MTRRGRPSNKTGAPHFPVIPIEKWFEVMEAILEGVDLPSPPDDRPPIIIEDDETGEKEELMLTDSPLARLASSIQRVFPDDGDMFESAFTRYVLLIQWLGDPILAGYSVKGEKTTAIHNTAIEAAARIPVSVYIDQYPTAAEFMQYIKKVEAEHLGEQ